MEGWTAFFGGLAIWFGIVIGLTSVLDFLLPDKQKQLITDKLNIYWNWLDDNRK